MVEQEAVNFEVAGSNPASRAKIRTKIDRGKMPLFLFWAGRIDGIRTCQKLAYMCIINTYMRNNYTYWSVRTCLNA